MEASGKRIRCLCLYDICSCGTFLAVRDVELDTLTFSEGLEAFALDGREVYEHILTRIRLNETKTLCLVEPLNSTFSHGITPW